MTNASQDNLISLARKAQKNNDIPQAKQYLLEGLRLGHNTDIVCQLCEIYLQQDQDDQAYALLKEEPDLFSDSRVFGIYLDTLQKKHYFIEFLELKNLLNKEDLAIEVEAVDDNKQLQIMQDFLKLKNITQADYLTLFNLDKENFVNFAKSLLLNPAQSFALRISLCEDLVKLGIDQEISVYVLGEEEKFVPNHTLLLEKDPIYREVCVSIADYLRRDPSKLPLMIGEMNVVLGMLYPKLHKYIQNPDQFAHDFRRYIETKDGGVNQKLLEKIYEYLALEKTNDIF